MLEKGTILDINGREGIVIGMKKYDDKLYINVGFQGDSVQYKIYSVDFLEDEMVLKIVKDANLLSKLVYDFTMEALQ